MKAGIDYGKLNPDRRSGEPLHLQLYNSLVREIRSLPPNEHVALMSERELSLLLKLNRNTTHRAYGQLVEERLVRRMPDKSLVVRSDARTRITGAYPVIGVLMAMDFPELVERPGRGILPYLEGLIGRCSQRNISCLMLRAPDPDASPKEIEAFAEEHFSRLCGVIHLGGLNLSENDSDPVLEQLLKHTEIPQLCLSGRVPVPYVGSIYADPAPGLNELCATLKKRGFRSAGVIGLASIKSLFHNIAADRAEAMREAVEKNGLELRFCERLADDFQNRIRRILTSPDRPEVLLCHDDRLAHQVMEQAAALGISIPGDLALAGYDCRQEDPFLASIFTDPRKIAEQAIDMVMDHFENGISEKNRIKVLNTSFSDGQSIGGKK
ncbi:MAG: substrate-binding domain-containing protein [Lentisphaeria bacterium]|nr:substrate-binding domain-containing protein [Lentisphaeria bacterium]